tara:strand:+ start:476 stop:952 length:477 start_codon:yes stop_codon:yes gene_type:complete
MHIKRNNKESVAYLQGLRPLSKSLPKNIKILLKKKGYGYLEIVRKWNNLVGIDIASYSHPKSIKKDLDNAGNILVLEVERGNEMSIEYSKNEIINKINSFFGYGFISKVRLESINTKNKKVKNKNSLSQFYNSFEKNVEEIKNKNIKESLLKLIKAIK